MPNAYHIALSCTSTAEVSCGREKWEKPYIQRHPTYFPVNLMIVIFSTILGLFFPSPLGCFIGFSLGLTSLFLIPPPSTTFQKIITNDDTQASQQGHTGAATANPESNNIPNK